LNTFEADVLTKVKVQQTDVNVEDRVVGKFGKQKQEQIDAWLELTNAELMNECQKYNLAVSDKHIHNIQTLFNYLKQFEDMKKPGKKGNQDEEMALNLNNQFIRKNT
jgi:hypothetical protein